MSSARRGRSPGAGTDIAAAVASDRAHRGGRLGSKQSAATTEEDERLAWLWLRNRPEREYSFVDATSFVLMRRHAIHEAFAFDGDFASAGFVELRA